MSFNLTNETREDCRVKLGEVFGDVYYLCCSELGKITEIWQQFENLFCANQEKLDLLNESGRGFFSNVQDLFFRSVVLGLCRLSDPKNSRTKNGLEQNLTIQCLADLMEKDVHKERFRLLGESITNSTKFARELRDKYIAHNDLKLKMGSVQPLTPAGQNEVNNAIEAFHALLRFISLEFIDKDMLPRGSNSKSELKMLSRLYFGALKEKDGQAEIEAGTYNRIELPGWLLVNPR